MISLEIRVSGNGPTHFNFSSGSVTAVHLIPPDQGAELGVTVENLQLTTLTLSSSNGGESLVSVEIAEGPDPVWLSYTIDCTQGGSVSVGFAGSPTVRVNAGSYLGVEYDNGNPGPGVLEG